MNILVQPMLYVTFKTMWREEWSMCDERSERGEKNNSYSDCRNELPAFAFILHIHYFWLKKWLNIQGPRGSLINSPRGEWEERKIKERPWALIISVHYRASSMFLSLMNVYTTDVMLCLYLLYMAVELFWRFYNFLSLSLTNKKCGKWELAANFTFPFLLVECVLYSSRLDE